MKTIKEKGSQGYILNKDLAKYSSKVLFPEKLKKVTELLKNVPPPKFKKSA